ncbi:MAG: PIN domain-containing protein [Pirellulaceae bacterium]
MGIVLDADVVIRGERGTFDLAAWIGARPEETFAIAAITVAELWHGVERATGTRRKTREAYLQAIVSQLKKFSYTSDTALLHARIWAELESTGVTIGSYDLIVAATALEQNFAVATFNQKHFQAVAGLTVLVPAN